MTIREDADYIISESIRTVLPDEATAKALKGKDFGDGEVRLVAAGKAAWQMAKAADATMGSRIKSGVVVTKYEHVKGPIASYSCFEAGHPVPDENSFLATQKAIDSVTGLTEKDTVLFLLSGGGSALFEKPLIPGEELQDITKQLLACGADITEMNTLRKRLSSVKGGKFARLCEPAKVYCIILSDIIGDPLDMIASGPAYPDSATAADAERIVEKYHLKLSEKAKELLKIETPKELKNVETVITGSVRELCRAAEKAAKERGYETVFLTDHLDCEAREAGAFLGDIALSHQNAGKSLAFIAGGETIVHLTGHGKGGRNQELALSAALPLSGCTDTAVFSVGSDGTDGPTDAAGGYADSETKKLLSENGISVFQVLKENDAYNALKKTGGLIITGPTGTNVNDVAVLLIKRQA
jgi:glycerate 2-kinase